MEDKGTRFRRVAEARVNKLLKMLRLLGNCSGKNYEYTPEQVQQIFSTLRAELDTAEQRFLRPGKAKTRFLLEETYICPYCETPVLPTEGDGYFIFRGEHYHECCFHSHAASILVDSFGAEFICPDDLPKTETSDVP